MKSASDDLISLEFIDIITLNVFHILSREDVYFNNRNEKIQRYKKLISGQPYTRELESIEY
jgi:hypothetical protein